jgi:hypothetical protein
MILINGGSSAWQEFCLTLQEAILWEGTPTHYLMEWVCMASGTPYYMIANVVETNPRYTMIQARIGTSDPTGGSALITERGLFRYNVYGQNSSTNLDPEDGSVIGVAESGILRITGEEIGQFPDLDLPDNILYYE